VYFCGHEKGEFIKNINVDLEGVVLLAGTDLWDILQSQGWSNGISGLSKIDIIDPISLLMKHLTKILLKAEI
jgi:hypothetical protein